MAHPRYQDPLRGAHSSRQGPGPLRVHLLLERDELALIDTGAAGSEEIIYDYIRSFGRRPEEIFTIVLTHSHPDHIGSACRIKNATGCKVMAHPAERERIEDTARQVRDRPVPGFDILVAGPVKGDRFIEDGEVVELSGLEARVIHTPGHSHGSVSLHIPAEGALITGDAVPIPGDLPIYDDALAQLRSVERLKKVTNVRVLLSAWDEPRKSVREVLARSLREPLTPQGCSGVLASLGLPPAATNPLLVRTVATHLAQRDEPELAGR